MDNEPIPVRRWVKGTHNYSPGMESFKFRVSRYNFNSNRYEPLIIPIHQDAIGRSIILQGGYAYLEGSGYPSEHHPKRWKFLTEKNFLEVSVYDIFYLHIDEEAKVNVQRVDFPSPLNLVKSGTLKRTYKKEPRMDKPGADSERVNFDSGAQRSAAVEEFRYDLFHPISMQRLARVWATGANRYGAHNWELGFPMPTLFNHLLAHIFDYLSGDRSEDHLAHAGCNIFMLMVEDALRYDQNRRFLREPGNILSPEMKNDIRLFQENRKKEKEKETKTEQHQWTVSVSVEDEPKEPDILCELGKLFANGTLAYKNGEVSSVRNLLHTKFPYNSINKLRNALEEMGVVLTDQGENMLNITYSNRGENVDRSV